MKKDGANAPKNETLRLYLRVFLVAITIVTLSNIVLSFLIPISLFEIILTEFFLLIIITASIFIFYYFFEELRIEIFNLGRKLNPFMYDEDEKK